MCAKRNAPPILNTLEELLQGHPEAYLDVAVHTAEGGMQVESDRAYMTEAARRWLVSGKLADDEAERVKAVWLDGAYRSALNVPRSRRDELRRLVLPRSQVEAGI
jgi:hypothetical protein